MNDTLYSMRGACRELDIPWHLYKYHRERDYLPLLPTTAFGGRLYYTKDEVDVLEKHFRRWQGRK